jgi:hypothetical protein
MGELRLSPVELERRQRNAERRQRYRGPRQVEYQPRDTGRRSRTEAEREDRSAREVSVRLRTVELKEQVRTAATRAGLSMSGWIAELVEDTLRFDETIRADRTAET